GTVGGGTFRVLKRNAEEITRRAGRGIEIAQVAALGVSAEWAQELGAIPVIDDAFAVVNNPDLDIVVELIGGYDPARELVLTAIENGKHVVTANKALIAMHGNEIFEAAHRKGVMVAFEAAVAGGIPIIKAIREGLAGNRIEWLAGIINGTGNFILTEMRDKGREFNDVLAEAQRLGYAEADPTFDVEGIDAAHKLTILGSIAFGIPLQFDKVYTEGISHITTEDVDYAEQLGYRIKHLGIARHTDEGMNAVLVFADAVGPTLYYGAGAGSEPTASAVVADLVDVTRVLTADPGNRVPHLAFQPDALADLPILPMAAVETAYYLRMQAVDRPGVLADITRILGELDISIEAILQKEPLPDAHTVPVIILTHRIRERQMDEAIARIEALSAIAGKITRIRLEDLS
ncbi:MAG: homoserine dehydrogenase, partial [Gammaproteobacteria bacterium]